MASSRPSRVGHEEPRVFTPPLRELTRDTTLGFDVIDFAEDILGIGLFPWQRWLFVHALEIVGDIEGEWHLRYQTVVVEIGRQNGKTTMGSVLALFFLYVLGVNLTLGTAQDLEQAEDTWAMCVDLAQGNPDLASEVEHVWYTNGAKRLQLTNGRQYRVKASTRRAGRGKSADLILLDELREHRDWEAWGALTKTGMARDNSLVWCMSNAGDGSSVVLRHLRLQAHAALGDPDGIVAAIGGVADRPDDDDARDSALGWFEWSAPVDADPADPDTWAWANPSMGWLIQERKLRAAQATDPADVFKTECLCQWVEAVVQPPFPDDSWAGGTDATSAIPDGMPFSLGIDVAADRQHSAIAVCGRRADGLLHGEVIAYDHGIGWLVDWLRERVGREGWPQPIRVAMQGRGAPASAIIELVGAIDGVEVVECVGRDLGAWCGRLWDAVAASAPDTKSDACRLMHRPQPVLDLAANVATTRPVGDGAWAWDRAKSREDVSPLVALTLAHGLETKVPEQEPAKRVPTAYASRGVRTV